MLATTVEIPEGGAAVPVTRHGVVCGAPPLGWSMEADERSLRPPAADSSGARVAEVKIAADRASCSKPSSTVTVVAIGPLPDIDASSVVLYADEGRLEFRGTRLKDAQVAWQAGQRGGIELCLDPKSIGKQQQQCVIPVSRGLPGDASLRILPIRGRSERDVLVYDKAGGLVDEQAMAIRPFRIVLTEMFPASGAVDISQGPGHVPLAHPEAVASVDCGSVRCELTDGAVTMRGLSAAATSVTVRLRLAPRFVYAHGESSESSLAATLPVLRCPLAVASGPALRDVEDGKILVRMDARCVAGPRPRWFVDGNLVDIAHSAKTANDATLFLLRVGRITSQRITVTASRSELDAPVLGVVEVPTIPAPRPRVALSLPKHGPIDFLPTNRPAVLTVTGAGDQGRFVPLPVEGAYTVTPVDDHKSYLVRAEDGVSGFVSLRFGYRPNNLPAELADIETAEVEERVQRAVREANVPAPFSTSSLGDAPLVELKCADGHNKPYRVQPGTEERLPYAQRNTCQLVIHRERLRPEDGLQEISIDVDVTTADGSPRADAALHERLVLRPGADTQILPLKGGSHQFDHMVVRVSHVMDESRYALPPPGRGGLPSVQWSLTVEGGRARLYATVAIPAGLYRLNSPTGQLTLNFGVLSRITPLNRQGKEGLVGLELGLMGMGLVQPATATPYPATLGAVAGVGVRLPLGGNDAAVSVHLWGVYEFRGRYTADGNPNSPDASHWALIFGPSISIGNVGANF